MYVAVGKSASDVENIYVKRIGRSLYFAFCICENYRRKDLPSKNSMTIETCVAHAIHQDLDLLIAYPQLAKIPVGLLEEKVELIVQLTQESLVGQIKAKGWKYVLAKDAAALAATCQKVVDLPMEMLLKMCHTIIDFNQLDARFIAESGPVGLYYVRMAL